MRCARQLPAEQSASLGRSGERQVAGITRKAIHQSLNKTDSPRKRDHGACDVALPRGAKQCAVARPICYALGAKASGMISRNNYAMPPSAVRLKPSCRPAT